VHQPPSMFDIQRAFSGQGCRGEMTRERSSAQATADAIRYSEYGWWSLSASSLMDVKSNQGVKRESEQISVPLPACGMRLYIGIGLPRSADRARAVRRELKRQRTTVKLKDKVGRGVLYSKCNGG